MCCNHPWQRMLQAFVQGTLSLHVIATFRRVSGDNHGINDSPKCCQATRQGASCASDTRASAGSTAARLACLAHAMATLKRSSRTSHPRLPHDYVGRWSPKSNSKVHPKQFRIHCRKFQKQMDIPDRDRTIICCRLTLCFCALCFCRPAVFSTPHARLATATPIGAPCESNHSRCTGMLQSTPGRNKQVATFLICGCVWKSGIEPQCLWQL